MAGTTGLEPATSAVTGQRSNQLSYVPSFLFFDIRHVQEIAVFRCGLFLPQLPLCHGNYPISAVSGQHETLPSLLLQVTRNPEHLSMFRDSNCTKQNGLSTTISFADLQSSPTSRSTFLRMSDSPSRIRRYSHSRPASPQENSVSDLNLDRAFVSAWTAAIDTAARKRSPFHRRTRDPISTQLWTHIPEKGVDGLLLSIR
jgi:hypothetical protein